METFFKKPTVQKTLRYILAYLLFALLAILGLVIIVYLHNTFYRISLMATTRIGVGNVVHVWGGFFLGIVYVIGVVLLESTMNKAAKTWRLLAVSVRVFAIEAGFALLAIIARTVAQWILIPG